MAVLYKNGTELFRCKTPLRKAELSFRSNGRILIRRGSGWKVLLQQNQRPIPDSFWELFKSCQVPLEVSQSLIDNGKY